MSLLLLSLLSAAPISVQSTMLFEGGGQWWLFSRDGGLVRKISNVGGLTPRDAAISPDAKRWAIVVDDPRRPLWLWEEGATSATPVAVKGTAQTPTFSADGQVVYFAGSDMEHPMSGPRMRNYEQLWRFRFDSPRPEKLSASRGCHMWPVLLPMNKVLFTHANCEGEASLDVLDAAGPSEQMLVPSENRVRARSAIT